MLIYLIIAAELAILYTVFWYVYVRDPKPYKIIGNPWGKYGETGFKAGGADPTLPFSVEQQSEIMQWWHSEKPADTYPDYVAVRNGTHIEIDRLLPSRRIVRRRLQTRHGAIDYVNRPGREDEAFISKVLGMFSRTLDVLNVKAPKS